MSMVHDNTILSYNVDFLNSKMEILTEYKTDTLHEQTMVIFDGYLTHEFNHILKHNVIFDIEEISVDSFIKGNRILLESSVNYGYPIHYNFKYGDTTFDFAIQLTDFLQNNSYKIFELTSSYLTDGWIIAKEMKLITDTL